MGNIESHRYEENKSLVDELERNVEDLVAILDKLIHRYS